MTARMKRLTISVPREIIESADEIVAMTKTSRSKIITDCLRDMINERRRHLLIEGYTAMAKAHRDFAKVSEKAAREALPERKS